MACTEIHKGNKGGLLLQLDSLKEWIKYYPDENREAYMTLETDENNQFSLTADELEKLGNACLKYADKIRKET